MQELPIIDITPLRQRKKGKKLTEPIRAACVDKGFFYIVGHRIPLELESQLEGLARTFFDWPESAKLQYSMANAGRAWRGFFPVGSDP